MVLRIPRLPPKIGHPLESVHLQTVFHFDDGKALKYYITNTLKKPNRVSIHQFFVQVEQLNSYLEMRLVCSTVPRPI